MATSTQLKRLIQVCAGEDAASAALNVLDIRPVLHGECDTDAPASRAVIAMALNVLLFIDLLARTPTAHSYVADRRASHERVKFDHGAMRTIRFAEGPTGALPPGEEAFLRILQPLGYTLAGIYPLERLRMTGRAYVQRDFPEDVPQIFLSELHVERLAPPIQVAAHAIFDSSSDPLTTESLKSLAHLAQHGEISEAQAAKLLPALASAFGRCHATPRLADYLTVLSTSAEAAWIATEGSVFNHATDRVGDLETLASTQRALGRAMKPDVEVSRSGRVRQTAFRADPVERIFLDDGGAEVRISVPGSFYEFISRDVEPGLGLDLRFDSANAEGIFKMTEASAS